MPNFLITDSASGKKFNVTAPSMQAAQDAYKTFTAPNFLHPHDVAPPVDPLIASLPLTGTSTGVGYTNGVDAEGNRDPGTQTFGTSSGDTLNPLPAISAGADAAAGAIPMVGQTLQSLRDQANAAATGTTPAQSRVAMDKTKADNPDAVALGTIAGKAAPYVAASLNPITAGAMGLEGTLGMRLLMGGLSSETLNVGDRFVKGQDPVTAAVEGTKETAEGLPFFALGSAGPKGAAVAAAPTVDALKAQADPLYKAAEDSGVLFSGGAVKDFVDQVTSDAQKRGLDTTLTPQSVAAIKRIQDIAYPPTIAAPRVKGGAAPPIQPPPRNMTMQDAMTLRKVLGNAVDKSMGTSDSDASLAMMIRNKFDDFLENSTAPGSNAVMSGNAADAHANLVGANKLWSQASNGQMLDTAIDLAQSKAATNGTPVANALRTEFGKIDQGIIKGDINGFSKDQIATIRDVAYGTGAQKLAEFMGKAKGGPLIGAGATNGAWLGLAAAGPSALGTGAALGAGTALGAKLIGSIGRASATRQVLQNAHYASAVAKNPALGPSASGALTVPLAVSTMPGTVARTGTLMSLGDWDSQNNGGLPLQ